MNLAQSGDVVRVMPGTYNQQLIISKNGITFEGSGAIIDTTANFGIWVKAEASNVIVRGFTVTRTWAHAIFIEGRFVTVEDNTVYRSVLENGTLTGNTIVCNHTRWSSGIKTNRTSNVTIKNNKVYENCGEGINATMSWDILIVGNTVWDNKQVNIYVDNSYNVQVLNNRSYCTNRISGNTPVGIALGEEGGTWYEGWGAQLRDVTIKGNILETCSTGIMAFGSDVGGTLTNITIDGNFVPSGTSAAISIDHGKCSNVAVSNNFVWKMNLWARCPSGVTLSNNQLISNNTTFYDVPAYHSAYDWIETLYANGITGGCGTNIYCPGASVTRAQMAVFLLRAKYGSAYTPSAATGAVFNDISSNTFAAAWIEQLAAEGVTGGCGGGNYCPNALVTRAQMAIFLLRAKYGSSYTPPEVTSSSFNDVPPGSFGPWIEQLAAEGITGGCGGGNYCPNFSVTRAQMAIFLVRAFNLSNP